MRKQKPKPELGAISLAPISIEVDTRVPVCLIEDELSPYAYSGQVGGIACSHPTVRGVLLPLGTHLEDAFMAALMTISCPDACMGEPIKPALAKELEKKWPTPNWTPWFLKLDKSRLHLGTEAWFPVVFYKTKRGISRELDFIEWLDGRIGFLLMPDNCD